MKDIKALNLSELLLVRQWLFNVAIPLKGPGSFLEGKRLDSLTDVDKELWNRIVEDSESPWDRSEKYFKNKKRQ